MDISVKRLVYGGGTVLLVLVENVFGNIITGWGRTAFWLLFFVFIVFFIISLVMDKNKLVEPVIKAPVTLTGPAEYENYARKGLILFLSLYNPMNSEANKLSFKEIQDAADAGDWQKLAFPHTNFAPAIEAVTCHASKMDYCWVVSTRSTEKKQGSDRYRKVFMKYLEDNLLNLHCIIRDDYLIDQSVDSEVINKTRDLLIRIYDEAEDLKLKPKDLIVDITGGFRGITLGAFLACLDKERDIEYVGTHFVQKVDKDGLMLFDQEGLTPILCNFEVKIHEPST